MVQFARTLFETHQLSDKLHMKCTDAHICTAGKQILPLHHGLQQLQHFSMQCETVKAQATTHHDSTLIPLYVSLETCRAHIPGTPRACSMAYTIHSCSSSSCCMHACMSPFHQKTTHRQSSGTNCPARRQSIYTVSIQTLQIGSYVSIYLYILQAQIAAAGSCLRAIQLERRITTV